ncbi:MAG TPA: hypothetical protein PLI09_19185 [Candidatus Hydrogenedentes bacterium]|nr:hypothetical protein [Candidatus Hydrogenedentota bacterium]
MPNTLKGFAAYPASATEIGQQLHAAQESLHKEHGFPGLTLWDENDIPGRFVVTPILEGISHSDFLLADVTQLNFNVAFEIGFAIGQRKRILLVRSNAHKRDDILFREFGVFDTLGYKEYDNSKELVHHILSLQDTAPLVFNGNKLNHVSPIYLLMPQHKTDIEIRLNARIKKARIRFRSFDPEEQIRLSAPEAIENVAQSCGVIVPFLSQSRTDMPAHNLRGAFLAGMAQGAGKAVLLLQYQDEPIPLDYRDLVRVFTKPEQIDAYVGDFATEITDRLQVEITPTAQKPRNFLANITLGASSAENEFGELGEYYLETEEYRRTLAGEVQVVTGRKGSGKTALFLQVRNRLRGRGKIVILDLKPEGYQLLKFRESVLDMLEEGTKEHTITAFWEYLLLLEICHKILTVDKERHVRDHNLYSQYKNIAETYQQDTYISEGDFAERMLRLTSRIADNFQNKYGTEYTKQGLSNEAITELLYMHDVAALSGMIMGYLRHKEGVWILFDNLDKGWPAQGISADDVTTLRCLLDALGKLQRTIARSGIAATGVIFIRNDVYELLVENTPDRGKTAKVAIDWSDSELLRELLLRRLKYGQNALEECGFDDVWPQVCVSHIRGEESAQYLIDRSLMRPRCLIDLIQLCKSHAVNLRHDRILEGDILQGEEEYSTGLIDNISFEIRDVYPAAGDLLYEFIESPSRLSQEAVISIIKTRVHDDQSAYGLLDFLLWYGFLGVVRESGDIAYIYSVKYNIKRLKALVGKRDAGTPTFHINPAFWAGLEIREQ